MPVNRDVIVNFLLVIVVFFSIGISTGYAANNEAVFETNKGTIIIALDEINAPETVSNFKSYVDSGFYDGTIFHRVIAGFMIQGGGFNQEFDRKPTKDPIQNEAYNNLKNATGTIAMARTGDPHSATSQFFINVSDNVSLNHRAKRGNAWGYAVFGKVIEGMEIVMEISRLKTTRKSGHQNAPVDAVVIKKVFLQ